MTMMDDKPAEGEAPEVPAWINLDAIATSAQRAELRAIAREAEDAYERLLPLAVRYSVATAAIPRPELHGEQVDDVLDAVGFADARSNIVLLVMLFESARDGSLHTGPAHAPAEVIDLWEATTERRPRCRPEDVDLDAVCRAWARLSPGGVPVNLAEIGEVEPDRARYLRAFFTLWAVHPERHSEWVTAYTDQAEDHRSVVEVAEDLEAIIAEVCA